MFSILILVTFYSFVMDCSVALSFSLRKNSAAAPPKFDSSFSPPNMSSIFEQACKDAVSQMKRVKVPVSEEISDSGYVGISYIHWPAKDSKKSSLPLVMVHGFASSALEYRRLGEKLASRGIDTYAVDMLGWGFTQLEGVSSFSAETKVEALKSFTDTMFGGKSFVAAGASLGGAAVIELAASNSDVCKGLILINAQGLVDDIGPIRYFPTPLASLCAQVLKSFPFCSSVNQMAYFDKETFATEDSVHIARLHCLQEGWSDALVSFMQSGGFSPSTKVPLIEVPSLILWGREDEILDGNEFANKLVDSMKDGRLQWVEECGHVPHLEKPEQTSEAITMFLTEKYIEGCI